MMEQLHLTGIGDFTPLTARDVAEWARLVAFLQRHGANAFSRDPQIGGHVTGSAVVLSPDHTAMLLTHHRKLDRWLQLGGHCDGLADARATALREAHEESGLAHIDLLNGAVLDVDIHEIPASAKEPAHLHYDIRFAMVAADTTIRMSEESRALAWVPLDRLESYTDAPSVLRLRDRIRRIE